LGSAVFRECFVCGVREQSDGLGVYAGLVEGREPVHAAPWLVRESAAEIVWAAIDCPGAYAVGADGRGEIVLGRMTARVNRVPEAGERCVVAAWPLGEDGRKLFAGTALFAPGGEVLALARQVWIAPRREGDHQTAVVVVGGEEVHGHRLHQSGSCPDLELLSQLPYAPLADDLDRRRVGETECVADLAPHKVTVPESGQLEHAAAGCEHAPIVVADDEPGGGGGEVVLEQTEEEPEPAVSALDGLRGQALVAVEVDRAASAVWTDVQGHAR
jgi:hypothetical protein